MVKRIMLIDYPKETEVRTYIYMLKKEEQEGDRKRRYNTRRRNIAPSHQILRPIYSSAPGTDRRYDSSSVTQSNLIQSIPT
jgi:hypothetical protein